MPESVLYEKVEECLESVSVDEEPMLGPVYIDQGSKTLIVDQFQSVSAIKIMDTTGRIVKQVGSVTNSVVSINDLNAGIYLFQFQMETGAVVKQLYVRWLKDFYQR